MKSDVLKIDTKINYVAKGLIIALHVDFSFFSYCFAVYSYFKNHLLLYFLIESSLYWVNHQFYNSCLPLLLCVVPFPHICFISESILS